MSGKYRVALKDKLVFLQSNNKQVFYKIDLGTI